MDTTADAENCGRITTALASGAALCASCIAIPTRIPQGTVERLLLRIGQTLRVEVGGTPCDSCRTMLMVYRLP